MKDPAKGTRGGNADEVLERFVQWRRTRAKKARIPDDLWEAAVEVARRDGVNRTAKVLHLDGGKLMRRLVGSGEAGEPGRKDAPAAFIELVSSASDIRMECVVEAESAEAGTVRIQLKAVTVREVAELGRALLGRS
jgi:hypothetical protein